MKPVLDLDEEQALQKKNGWIVVSIVNMDELLCLLAVH